MMSDLLRTERRLRGWSQAKLAMALGVSPRTVRRWELGQSVPYTYYQRQLAIIFGKTAQQLGLPKQAAQKKSKQTHVAL